MRSRAEDYYRRGLEAQQCAAQVAELRLKRAFEQVADNWFTLAEDPSRTQPPSCVSPALQLKREWSPGPEFGWIPRKSVRPFKGIICDDISEFESPWDMSRSLTIRVRRWRFPQSLRWRVLDLRTRETQAGERELSTAEVANGETM